MSKRLFRESAFIELLLNGDKQQAYALIDTATGARFQTKQNTR